MSGLTVAVEPTREPLTVIEVRDALRLDDDVDETLVMSYIIAAREWAENYTGRALITRTVHQFIDAYARLPDNLTEGFYTGVEQTIPQNYLELAISPVISVSSVSYFTDSGVDDLEYDVTVAGGVIVIDGASQPTLTLKRGSTYRFKQDDASNSSHPFKFSTAEHGTHGGGNEYTTGVTFNGTAGSAGSYTEITVDASAPDALYYYCGNHSNMGGSLTITNQDTEATWAAKNYYVDSVREPARILLRDAGSFPTDLRAANGLKIVYTAGYGTTTQSVPEPIRIAMMQYCAFLYEHRGDFERYPPPVPPKVLTQLLTPYTIMRFGSTPYQNVIRQGIG